MIVANSYLENCSSIIMRKVIEQQDSFEDSIEPLDAKPCFCEKKTCAIGLASIGIGIGGFILANLL